MVIKKNSVGFSKRMYEIKACPPSIAKGAPSACFRGAVEPARVRIGMSRALSAGVLTGVWILNIQMQMF